MVTSRHICPYGIKAKDLLQRKGFEVEDHHLASREEADAFKKEKNVETTPQIFIDGERIGGYTDLRVHFGMDDKSAKSKTTYAPVIAVFSLALTLAIAVSWRFENAVMSFRLIELFVAFSMCILAILKLRDLEAFSMQFLAYDLLAQRKVIYSYVYPFAEAAAGAGMVAGFWIPLTAAVAVFIGSIGTVSVIKAVYVDKRELKCACVGGNSNVPLGFVSLTENLMMTVMGLWMLAETIRS